MTMRKSLIALGGNLPTEHGPPQVALRLAMARIAAEIGPITGKSRLWRTPCVPAGAGPDYVNGAVAVATGLTPRQVLTALHAIENDLSRARTGRWAARTVDLDLLAQDDLVLPDAETQGHWRALPPDQQPLVAPDRLILPHPRMQERGFVLAPLAEVAADWRHPLLGLTVAQMLASLPPDALAGMQPMDD
jgi:2-amino-4-hydroxy-6-hydroxymethyldihydropteridine diphosphokinase